ncbi:MAG TPA: hypothetical protein VFH68_17465 [Polyangia bacterium]|jgi:hypothetical protein|nr:hypothetical protein [Polyangia bacterium]
MSQNSPLARVKEEFGGKDKLVDKIVGLLGSTDDEPKEELRKRLLGAANRKLIRLHQVATSLKQHGGHDKLADAAAAGVGRAKDKDYVTKLGSYSSGRLLDMVRVAERHAKAAGAAPARPKAPAKAKPEPKGKAASRKAAASGS